MNKNQIENWLLFFQDRGLSHELISSYIPYILTLQEKNIPVIFEKQHLSHLIGIKERLLDKIIICPDKFYREFTIPKKNGGRRNIKSPYPSLLMCQKWIYKNILLKDIPHPSCHGFTPLKSIITNALVHTQKKCILKMDLKDFFPSIPINWVIQYFMSIGYTHNVSFSLASLCCYERNLAQGAATSPYLSNLLLKKFDSRIESLCLKYKITYSRYADDLTFSGEYIPHNFSAIVEEIIKNYGLTTNKEKTRLMINTNQKIVTGISVAGEKISLPRKYKRKIKNELHFIMTYGYVSHINNLKVKDPNYLLSLLGKINFWLQVEPDNALALKGRNYLLKIIRNE